MQSLQKCHGGYKGLQPRKTRTMSCRQSACDKTSLCSIQNPLKTRSYVRYIPLQFLTLTLLLFILFVVFLLCTFCTDRTNGRRLKGLKPKYQRARHTGKIFTNVLCSGHICEPSVGRLFVTTGFRLFSGCCGIKLV